METIERTISPAMKAFLIHHYLRESVMEMDAAYEAGFYRLARFHCKTAKAIACTLCDFDIIGMATCCVLEEKFDYISRELNRRIYHVS